MKLSEIVSFSLNTMKLSYSLPFSSASASCHQPPAISLLPSASFHEPLPISLPSASCHQPVISLLPSGNYPRLLPSTTTLNGYLEQLVPTTAYLQQLPSPTTSNNFLQLLPSNNLQPLKDKSGGSHRPSLICALLTKSNSSIRNAI